MEVIESDSPREIFESEPDPESPVLDSKTIRIRREVNFNDEVKELLTFAKEKKLNLQWNYNDAPQQLQEYFNQGGMRII